MKLSQAKLGKLYKISHIEGSRIIKRRLLEMGLTSNSEIEILRIAPFKDPIIVKIRGYNLSLRLFEAACINVKNM